MIQRGQNRKSQNKFLSYKERNFKNSRSRILWLFAILICLIGILFIVIGPSKTITSIASIGNSIFRAKISAGQAINDGLDLSRSKSSLISERNDLSERVQELEAQLIGMPTLIDENIKLTEILARKKPESQIVMARILARPNQSLYDTLVIDVGSNDGIVVGQKVFGKGNLPIGLVSEVDIKNSKVKLFSTAGEKTKAVIIGNDIIVDLVGQGGGTFETTLPRDILVEKGTNVATLDDGLTVAIMEESLADSRDPFQRILFRSPVNLFELRFVSVEK